MSNLDGEQPSAQSFIEKFNFDYSFQNARKIR